MKTACIFLAPGFEEMEALATADVLIRGGVDVTLVSVADDYAVTGSHNITICADALVDDYDLTNVDCLICPGGLPGSSNLAACKPLCQALQSHSAQGKLVAAICAAPALVFAPLGLVDGKNATAYPGFDDQLAQYGATPVNQRVVKDSNVITGNGPSSAIPFGLAVLEYLTDKDIAASVAAGMLV